MTAKKLNDQEPNLHPSEPGSERAEPGLRDSLNVGDVVSVGSKKIWDKASGKVKLAQDLSDRSQRVWRQASRVAVPIGGVGGFCGDVLTPLGPWVAYLAIVFSLLTLVTGAIWFGVKKRQIKRALADGRIDDDEFNNIMSNGKWITVFAFSLVSSLVFAVFFVGQKVFAATEPSKGVLANVVPAIGDLQSWMLKLEASNQRIEKGNLEIKEQLTGVNAKLDAMSMRLQAFGNNSAVIESPSGPEDFYFNARHFEMQGDLPKARQAYLSYMKSNLPYLDPHLSLSNLIKLQDGKQTALETYSMFIQTAAPSGILARALLLEDKPRLSALNQLSKDFPEFAPTFYYLSKEYAAPERGQQTLENLKAERAALETFESLDNRGLFSKYFIDKRIAIGLQNEARSRSRKFSNMQDKYLDAGAKIKILPSENGWEGVIVLPYDGAEVLVRLPGEKSYTSTGFLTDLNPATGKPLPKTQISLREVTQKGLISIKYLDTQGISKGPYEQEFDPLKEFVAFAKKVMPQDPGELAPLHQWKNKKFVTMVQLLMFRGAIAKVSVGSTPQNLSKTLKLPDLAASYTIEDVKPDDPLVSQEIPGDWAKVYLRLDYADGSKSDVMVLQ